MACIFTTQYFQLTNGAKTLTHIVFCTFLIKSDQNLVDDPLKYTEQQRFKCQKNTQKLLTCIFGRGSKRVFDLF